MRNQGNNTNNRMESLDGLRGVAALIVVFTHAMALLQPFSWHFITGISQEQKTILDWVILNSPIRILFAGSSAVTLFFVLSGFVLALPWLTGKQLPYRSFVISRICRIYLPYLAAMTLAAVFAFTLGGEKIPGASDWVNIYAWTNKYSPLDIPSVILMLGNDYSTWLDNPTWSLVWEMRVSLMFPLLVIPVIRWGLRGTVAVGLGLWGAYTLGTLVAGQFPAAAAIIGQPQNTFYFAMFFVIGILMACYRNQIMRMTSLGDGIGSLVLVIAGAAVWTIKWGFQPELMRAVGAALILAGCASKGLPQRWLETAPVQWLGRVSYSLYLVHVPIYLIGEYTLHLILPHSMIALIAIAVALATAEVFYRLIERPTHQLGRYLVKRSATQPGMRLSAEVG
jgi:peptidoglycan/LPS O-acetylase OafA/YrhL